MDPFKIVSQLLLNSLRSAFDNLEHGLNFAVEVPKSREHGDISSNIALIASKYLLLPAVEIAERLKEEVKKTNFYTNNIANIEVAGKGFVNFTFNYQFWRDILFSISELGQGYGKVNYGNGQLINLESVSANPTGVLHVGNARGAVYGDVLANLLEWVGYKVTREYYINDAGQQIEILKDSLFIRYKQNFLKYHNLEMPEYGYPGEYLVDLGGKLFTKYGDSLLTENLNSELNSESRDNLIKDFGISEILTLIKEDLLALGVKHDVFFSEKLDLIKKNEVEEVIKLLENKGLLYRGVLEPPKANNPAEDWEPREQLLFKAQMFGDESDRPLVKSDGTYTYFASDMAYHYNKFKRGFKKMFVLLGADHIGYVQRLKAAVKAISDGEGEINILISQMVNVLIEGKPIKMSKRKGNFITLKEILHDIGKDLLRFSMVWKKSDTHFDLDLVKVKEQSKDNPLFYIQYAHTRIVSVIGKAIDLGVISSKDLGIYLENSNNTVKYFCHIRDRVVFNNLTEPQEVEIIKSLSNFPKVVEAAVVNNEPHRLAYYLYELATSFHSAWAKGSINNENRFVLEDNFPVTKARILLSYLVAELIGKVFKLMGITPMLKM